MNTYGEKIKIILEKKGRSQADLSRLTGLSPQTISSIIKNKSDPSLELLKFLNREFDVNLNWIVADEGLPFNTTLFEQSENEFTQKVLDVLKMQGLIK